MAVALGVCGVPAVAAGTGGAACDLPVTASAQVMKALDGDTIETAGGVIRLAGIEAPKALGFGDAHEARAARAALDGLVAGETVGIAQIGDAPDRYGRIHAHVFLEDGLWLQAAMVEGGMARIRALAGEEACLSTLLAVESAARDADRGVWAGAGNDPLSADDPSLSGRNGLYAIVEGRVLSVGRGSVMIFLDFGYDYRRDFTVMIPKRLEDQFTEAGMPVAAFEGRRLRVRGMIEQSGGPAIRLSDPMAVELLDE